MIFLFKAVPVPGVNISLPLCESTESCKSLLQVEWQPDLYPHSTTHCADKLLCRGCQQIQLHTNSHWIIDFLRVIGHIYTVQCEVLHSKIFSALIMVCKLTSCDVES